jgi:hypothetical protein
VRSNAMRGAQRLRTRRELVCRVRRRGRRSLLCACMYACACQFRQHRPNKEAVPPPVRPLGTENKALKLGEAKARKRPAIVVVAIKVDDRLAGARCRTARRPSPLPHTHTHTHTASAYMPRGAVWGRGRGRTSQAHTRPGPCHTPPGLPRRRRVSAPSSSRPH